MVSEVSATLVETMILRACVRATARSCCSGGNSPCSGKLTNSRNPRRALNRLQGAVDLIRAGMNTSISPSSSPATRSHSRAATSHTGSWSKFGERCKYSIATGKLRPCDTSTSHGARYCRSMPASSVADITMIFRSGRVVCWIWIARASEMSP